MALFMGAALLTGPVVVGTTGTIIAGATVSEAYAVGSAVSSAVSAGITSVTGSGLAGASLTAAGGVVGTIGVAIAVLPFALGEELLVQDHPLVSEVFSIELSLIHI